MEDAKDCDPKSAMEKVLTRRAVAMAKAVESGLSHESLITFFERCLRAHEIDTLKEVEKL
jgi:hypothetical protein